MFNYILAKNGCSQPILFNKKKVYFPSSLSSGINQHDMNNYIKNKNYNTDGWLETDDFYVFNEKGMKTSLFLKLCQIGLN